MLKMLIYKVKGRPTQLRRPLKQGPPNRCEAHRTNVLTNGRRWFDVGGAQSDNPSEELCGSGLRNLSGEVAQGLS